VPVNDIGGAVDFSNFATVGVQQIEVLREPNSALYGSDALAGVVSMTTTRGTTKLPLFTYAGDGGNFSTYHQEVTAAALRVSSIITVPSGAWIVATIFRMILSIMPPMSATLDGIRTRRMISVSRCVTFRFRRDSLTRFSFWYSG